MNAEATVLKLYPLGENGLIAVWCTEEGLIRTAAKSARKTGSPFAGRLDIFYQCRMRRGGCISPDFRHKVFPAP